ncbi:MAG: hypothetical protein MUF49_01720 [Oculatellaceae cyanobacterium Prado106]|nr:hypothetical protein [Oculatellaceae cyanobacterium Prado106]
MVGLVGSTAPFWAIASAQAQDTPPNQSDNSGSTVVEPFIQTRDEENNFIDQEVLEAAERLSQDLGRARIACAESRVAAANLPRRFARGPVTEVICISRDCETLRVVTEQARTFLQSLNEAQREQIRQAQAFQLW